MNLSQLLRGLNQLCLNRVSCSQPLQTCVRDFHCTQRRNKIRKHIPVNMKMPKLRFEANVDMSKYTMTPLPTAKTGGRGPDGRIWQDRIGGGDKLFFRMVDHTRIGPKTGEPFVERVKDILKDGIRTASLAVVAGGNKKRYIIASENMKVGDLLTTSGQLTSMPIQAKEGDSHPVGSLPLGTIVYNIEKFPGHGGVVARAAGTSGVYVRKVGDQCYIRMPSKREMMICQECVVTVGRVSNVDHNKTKKMTKAGEMRWRGYRPKSGKWHRKTGYHGRKIRPMKPAAVYDQPAGPRPEVFRFTV